MDKIHLKREVGVHLALCGIHPDKERFTTVDLVTKYKRDEICKVCLKVSEKLREMPER
jgi:hypothetical protein